MTREDGMSVSKEAMHEAGHAVVARVLGFTVTGIDIIPREVPNCGGQFGKAGANINFPQLGSLVGQGELAVENIITVIYAGVASEIRVFPDAKIEENFSESDGDRALEYATLALFPPVRKNGVLVSQVDRDRLGRFLLHCQDRAKSLVVDNSDAIEAVAKLLQVRNYLSGDEIDVCLKGFRSI